MSFLKSAVNQVGRDLGKVVSNHLFKGSHSISYREVNNIKSSQRTHSRRAIISYKSDFEKAINFQIGHRPSTLVTKICGVYTVIKNESQKYISDGYLDTSESENLFRMMNEFNNKVDDVCDILEIDEINNEKEINQLIKVVEKTRSLFKKTLQVSADGCFNRYEDHKMEAEEIQNINFLNYVGLHIIWMGNYARRKEKSILNTVLANLLDVFTVTFPITRSYLFIKGVFTFFGEETKLKKEKSIRIQLANLEEKRGKAYLEIKRNIPNEIIERVQY